MIPFCTNDLNYHVVSGAANTRPAATTRDGERQMIELNFEKMGGLIPAIAQDVKSGDVLMLVLMNREAWEKR